MGIRAAFIIGRLATGAPVIRMSYPPIGALPALAPVISVTPILREIPKFRQPLFHTERYGMEPFAPLRLR